MTTSLLIHYSIDLESLRCIVLLLRIMYITDNCTKMSGVNVKHFRRSTLFPTANTT